jgi:NADH-quinone oxidoreductase subunit L
MVEFIEVVPWLVWLTPIVGALLTPIFAKVNSRFRNYMAVLSTFIAALFATLLLPKALVGETIHQQVPWIPALNIDAGVLADPLSVFMTNIVVWISFLIMVYSLGYMRGEPNLTRYWFFMNFFIGNMLLIVLSDNFLQLFFGWEGVGLCSYGLIGFWHRDELKDYVGTPGHKAWGLTQAYSPSQAGMKAFMMTRVGDVSLLIGLLILYFYAGTFSFTELAEKTGWGKELAAVGLLIPVAILIFGGAVGKSAQFPLHEWLPDAMAGPTAVSALIHAATMVKAGVFLVARIGPIFYNAATAAEQITPLFITIAWIGVFTAFLAATQASVAREIKKVLAYSTVSQIGYMMLALGVAGLANDFATGYTAGFFHLTSHAIFKAALFMGAGSLIHATGSKYLTEMGGLRKHMRYTYISMTIVAGSLAGIPFLSGFWSKDAIFAATLEASGYGATWILYGLAVVTALMTAFYSFRMIGLAFFGNASKYLEKREYDGHHIHEAPKVMWIPYMILAAATLIIGIVGYFFEEGLHEILGHTLEQEFGNIQVAEAVGGINSIALMSSLVAVGIGGFIAYYYYIARRADPSRVVERIGIIRRLYQFFDNRWYINAFYYKVFVTSTEAASRITFRGLELGVIDRISGTVASSTIYFSKIGRWFDIHIIDGVANGIADAGKVVSSVSRRIQTGVVEEYVFAYTVGIVLLILFLFFVLMTGVGA